MEALTRCVALLRLEYDFTQYRAGDVLSIRERDVPLMRRHGRVELAPLPPAPPPEPEPFGPIAPVDEEPKTKSPRRKRRGPKKKPTPQAEEE